MCVRQFEVKEFLSGSKTKSDKILDDLLPKFCEVQSNLPFLLEDLFSFECFIHSN